MIPSAPTSLIGVVNNITVLLSWSAPSLSGSSPLASYNVYTVSNGVYTLVGNTINTTYTISNLNPYSTYNFAVNAFNTQGLFSSYALVTLNTACFKEGTKILYFNENTNEEEYIEVEKLRKGMKVKTHTDGLVKIELIGKSVLYNSYKEKKNKDGLYKLDKNDHPELFEDLYMTGAHSILVDEITEEQQKDIKETLGNIYITKDKYRLPMCLAELAQPYNEVDEFVIWHFALENDSYYENYGVYANGLLVETTSIRYMKEIYDCELIE